MVQHNLFLAYILSTRPTPGIRFGHSYYASHFIRFNITYSWHTFCQSVKPGVFRAKKEFQKLIDRLFYGDRAVVVTG